MHARHGGKCLPCMRVPFVLVGAGRRTIRLWRGRFDRIVAPRLAQSMIGIDGARRAVADRRPMPRRVTASRFRCGAVPARRLMRCARRPFDLRVLRIPRCAAASSFGSGFRGTDPSPFAFLPGLAAGSLIAFASVINPCRDARIVRAGLSQCKGSLISHRATLVRRTNRPGRARLGFAGSGYRGDWRWERRHAQGHGAAPRGARSGWP